MDPDAVEIRVLGCLLEKQRTTPDAYPLTLNALRLACNQSTNREPVVDYDEATIRQALGRLSHRRWVRLASYHGSRASKYRHLLDEALRLADDELAILGVLMLRGPQTPGELKQRTERLHRFADLTAIHETLSRLIDRELVERLERRPGQKEERYEQRLGGEEDPLASAGAANGAGARLETSRRVDAVAAPEDGDMAGRDVAATASRAGGPPAAPAAGTPGATDAEVAELREELASLRTDLSDLRAEVARLREALGG